MRKDGSVLLRFMPRLTHHYLACFCVVSTDPMSACDISCRILGAFVRLRGKLSLAMTITPYKVNTIHDTIDTELVSKDAVLYHVKNGMNTPWRLFAWPT